MEELKTKLIQICNESGLPLEAIYFVVKDVWRDVEATLRSVQEKQAAAQEEKKE
jgi:hypothetical protein